MHFTIGLEGYTDDQTGVRCTLIFDPDLFHVSMGSYGRVLTMPFTLECKTFTTTGKPTVFSNSDCKLLSLGGILAGARGSWNTVVPAHAFSYRTNNALTVPLRDEDIEAIEDFRSAGDVELHITLTGLAQVTSNNVRKVGGPPPAHPVDITVTETVPVSSPNSPQTGNADIIRIDQQHWIKLLETAGKRRLLLELAVPNLPSTPPWQEVARLLQVAEAHYRSGLFESVPERCRELIEGLTGILASQWNVDKPQTGGIVEWAKQVANRLERVWKGTDPKQAQDLATLIESGWIWTRSSHHYGSGVPKREEAAFVLRLTSDVYSFCVLLAEAYPAPLIPPV